MGRYLTSVITRPGETRRYDVSRQHVFAARANSLFDTVLIEGMPGQFKNRVWAGPVLGAAPIVARNKADIISPGWEWSAGMKKSFQKFLDVVNDEVWDDEWNTRTIERHYLKFLFCVDCLISDVTNACDYAARIYPGFRQLRDILTGLIDGPLAQRESEAEMGYRMYERIRETAG